MGLAATLHRCHRGEDVLLTLWGGLVLLGRAGNCGFIAAAVSRELD